MKGYGLDRLSRDAMFAALALDVIGLMLWGTIAGLVLCVLSAGFMALALYRMLSKKTEKREEELLGYERLADAVGGAFSGLFKSKKKEKSGDPAYKYFKCPGCGQELRAPKGRGRIRVTCSKCGTQFEKKV